MDSLQPRQDDHVLDRWCYLLISRDDSATMSYAAICRQQIVLHKREQTLVKIFVPFVGFQSDVHKIDEL